jgi:hypothetical protein
MRRRKAKNGQKEMQLKGFDIRYIGNHCISDSKGQIS